MYLLLAESPAPCRREAGRLRSEGPVAPTPQETFTTLRPCPSLAEGPDASSPLPRDSGFG